MKKFLLLSFVMKKIAKVIKKVGVFRVFDSALSCVVFLIIGVLAVVAVLAITYALARYNLFHAGGLLTGETVLSRLGETRVDAFAVGHDDVILEYSIRQCQRCVCKGGKRRAGLFGVTVSL